MKVAVVGLGKIGLPLAVQCASRAHRVTGADKSAQVVECVLSASGATVAGEKGLAERLTDVLSRELLGATTDTTRAVADSTVILVVVPLYVLDSGDPDFGSLDAATDAIGRGLSRGSLVIYETTVPVGTTRDRLTPRLEKHSGLRAGVDFFVAFSPERVSTGRVFADLAQYPKLVGGINAVSTRKAVEFYNEIIDFVPRPDLARPNGVWDLGSAESAELAKLAETTYRDVNISLANQFSIFAQKNGIDFLSIIEACNSQPYSHLHSPGIAVGGHCIPVYPQFYLKNDPDASVVKAARKVNDAMPEWAVELLSELHGGLENARVGVLGAAYRGGVKETAYSGVFPVVEALRSRNAIPMVHDPLYSAHELIELGFDVYHLGDPIDAAIVQTDHVEYRALGPLDLGKAKAVVDGRRVLDTTRWTGSGITPVVLGGSRGPLPTQVRD